MFSAEAPLFSSLAPLLTGGFLLAGTGENGPGGPLRFLATQLFDPAAPPGFTRVGDTATAGTSVRTATPLLDGGALLTGGLTRRSSPINDVVDRYDPGSSQWRAAGPMLHVRVLHTHHPPSFRAEERLDHHVAAQLRECVERGLGVLADDRGRDAQAGGRQPGRGQIFVHAGSMSVPRGGHTAALLPDGRVLIAGGDGNDPAPSPLGTEIFDPVTGQFSSGGDLQTPRDSHSAVTLTDGRVLIIGGEVPPELARRVGVGVPATEIFDPATGMWSAGPVLDPAFYAATVTMLSNGKVLVFGGQDAGGSPQAAAALFE